MTDTYTTVRREIEAEIEVKRSRFLCTLTPVADEAAARACVERARKDHWDARHHCSAFVLGTSGDVRRSNDDGEPSGTAGMPMLDVLVGAGLTDVVAVVTRWFGGTLLGTGGLVKAYSDAVRAAVVDADRVTYRRLVRLSASIDVGEAGRVENLARASGFVVEPVDYVTRAAHGLGVLTIGVEPARVDAARAVLAEATGGVGAFDPCGDVWHHD